MEIRGLLAHRNVYVLSTIGSNGQLKGTHYTCCLSYGSNPVWGVWTIRGKFLRFYGSRGQIRDAYSDLVWRTHTGTWTLAKTSDDEQSPVEKREEIAKHYGGTL